MASEYRRARLLRLRPPIALGGHTFDIYWGDDDMTWERCLDCHVCIPAWAVKEGMWSQFGLARWCPGMFAALPRGTDE
jgi:hypothetical protein